MERDSLTQRFAEASVNSDSKLLMFSTEEFAQKCSSLGTELMGVVELVNEHGELAEWFIPHAQQIERWVERGAHAEMSWMSEQLDKRQDPRKLLPEVRSGIALWISHHFPEPDFDFESNLEHGYLARVARYAWGRDYHNVLRRVLRQLIKWLQQKDESITCHGSVDTSPVLERAIAERCGIGWIGKSTMLIHPQQGTFGSIAILLTSATFKPQASVKSPHCGSCSACIDLCPTGALSSEGLDARRCISYWTIEHRGVIPRDLRHLLGEWTFGCDICQDVCPWSMKAARRISHPNLSLWEPRYDRARPDLIHWLKLSDTELNELLLGSPLRRAHPHGLKRNALMTLTNQKYYDGLPVVWDQLNHTHAVVRATAVWAFTMLSWYQIEDYDELQETQKQELHLNTWVTLSEHLSAETDNEVLTELRWSQTLLTSEQST